MYTLWGYVPRYLDVYGKEFNFNLLIPFDFVQNPNGKIDKKRFKDFVAILEDYRTRFPDGKVLLDCGAFSAYRQGFEINLKMYIRFIKRYRDWFDQIVALDVIKNPSATWRNYAEMADAGVGDGLIVVFHITERDEHLCRLVESSEYVGFGLPLGASGSTAVKFYQGFLYGADGKPRWPKRNFHGFGIGSPLHMQLYDWFSIDSTVALQHARFGYISYLVLEGSELVVHKISITERQKKQRWNYFNLHPKAKLVIDAQMAKFGFTHKNFNEEYLPEKAKMHAAVNRLIFNIRAYEDAVERICSGSIPMVSSPIRAL